MMRESYKHPSLVVSFVVLRFADPNGVSGARSATASAHEEEPDDNVTRRRSHDAKNVTNEHCGPPDDLQLEIQAPISNDINVKDTDIAFYYNRLFPFGPLVHWLTYCNDPSRPADICNDVEFFSRREVSFTCAKSEDNEIYIRWQSFTDATSLRQYVMQLKPHKLDIGAVYTTQIASRDISGRLCKPEQKEIVFDIDMDDYDDIRTCCTSKTVCHKCWRFLTVAMKLVETALIEDFGFRHILWVFSGRRGLHGWVCDSQARRLTTEGRAAIADYLNLITGSSFQKKKVTLKSYFGRKLHPMIDRSFQICLEYFPLLLDEQDFFTLDSPHLDKIADYLPETAMDNDVNPQAAFAAWRQTMKERQAKETNVSRQVWEKLCDIAGWQPNACRRDCPNWIKEIVLSYSYPRLDINVSKDIGHLLKSPFCVHRKTGRICVPIDPQTCNDFNPQLVPTISLLRRQYDKLVDPNDNSKTSLGQNVFKTSLGSYVRFFQDRFLTDLMRDIRREIKEIKDEFAAQQTGDWDF